MKEIKKIKGIAFRLLLLVVLAVFAGGCTTRNYVKLAEDFKREKQYEEALENYFKAVKDHPDRLRLKIDIDELLKEASVYYYHLGMEQQEQGNTKNALSYFKKSLEYDPGNNAVRDELKALLQQGNTYKSIDTVKKEMAMNIGMPEILKNPERMDLEFKTPTSLIAIFQVLSKTGNVNILFDPGFKDLRITLKLMDITFYDALERICTLYKLSYYVLHHDRCGDIHHPYPGHPS